MNREPIYGRKLMLGFLMLVIGQLSVDAARAQTPAEQSATAVQQGLVAVKAGNVSQSLQLFEQAIGLDPGNADAWHYWSYYQHVSGNLDKAIAGFVVAASFESVRANSLYLMDYGLHGSFGLLPGTAEEARSVSPVIEAFAGEAPKMLLQRDATEARLKQLHRPVAMVISTHGFFHTGESANSQAGVDGTNADVFENPLLRCGLALAGCNDKTRSTDVDQEDGILTGLEIVGCDFRGTRLVVLSACETGLGVVDNGEGVAGLRQAFQLAGAEAVVASLWQVPDHDTAELMKLFWQNLAKGQTKSAALRNAQLGMIKQIRESEAEPYPFRWAAFTLTGR